MSITKTATAVAPSSLDVFIDASSLKQSETRSIKVTANQLENKLLNGLVVAEFGTALDESWIGRNVVLVCEQDAPYLNSREERNEYIDNHSHGATMRRIIELAESKTTVRDGDHLVELCGMKRRAKGGDFKHDDPAISLAGDLKFYELGKDVNLAGSIDAGLIYEQGDGLLIARHPRAEPARIVLGQSINLWEIPGAWDAVQQLCEGYHEWNGTGRAGQFKPSNEFARIALHSESRDRLYIRNSVIKKHAFKFYRDLLFREKLGVEAWVERTEQVSDTFSLTVPKTPIPVTLISLQTILDYLISGKFAIPLYQRDIVTGNEFLQSYVASTVFTNNQKHRGIFMCHSPTKDGKVYIVDGQQRIMNAINRFFVDAEVRLEDCEFTFKNAPMNLSDRSWPEICEMAKTNPRIKKFVEETLANQFSVRHYDHTYSVTDMAYEYRIANSGASMNRQQLRASLGSPIGNVVRFFTGSALFRYKIEADKDMSEVGKEIRAGLTIHDATILKLNKRETELLYFGKIKTAEMELDKFISICFHRCTTWGPGYTENEDDLDNLYQSSMSMSTKDVLAVWKNKMEFFFNLLEDMFVRYCNNPYRIVDIRQSHHGIAYGVRGNRIFSRKEEWDLMMFLIIELQRRHTGKTLTITNDVVSWVLKQHVVMSVEPRSDKMGTIESTYGGEIRKGTKSWTNIQSAWFNLTWNKLLLDLPVGELAKIGFTFV